MKTIKESYRGIHRKTAASVGVLFIIATVVGVLGEKLFLDPILEAPDYLAKIPANANQVIIGSLLVLISAFAIAGIAIGLYPVLRKHNEGLALGSVGLRVMEGMLYIIGVVCTLSLLALSREYIESGTLNASSLQIYGALLLAVKEGAGGLSIITFTIGALMYYAVFYQSQLVPRWLSGWGIVAALSSLACALLTIFGLLVPFSTFFILMQLPIGLQEMVLAVWLIVRGFNPSAVASQPAKTTTKELLSAA